MLKIIILIVIIFLLIKLINYTTNKLSKGGADVISYFPYSMRNEFKLIACANHPKDLQKFYIPEYKSTFKSKINIIRPEVADIIKFAYYYYSYKYKNIIHYLNWTVYEFAILRSCMEGGYKWAQLAHSLKLFAYQLVYNDNLNENMYELYCNDCEDNKLNESDIDNSIKEYAQQIFELIGDSKRISKKKLRVADILQNEEYIPINYENTEYKFKLTQIKNSIDPIKINGSLKKKQSITLNCYFAYIAKNTYDKLAEALISFNKSIEMKNSLKNSSKSKTEHYHHIVINKIKNLDDNFCLVDIEINGVLNSDGDGMLLLGKNSNEKYLICVNRDEKITSLTEFKYDEINLNDSNLNNQAHLVKSINEIFTLAYWIKKENVYCFINWNIYFPEVKKFEEVVKFKVNNVYYFENINMKEFNKDNLVWI